jgi:beta-lactamase class A
MPPPVRTPLALLACAAVWACGAEPDGASLARGGSAGYTAAQAAARASIDSLAALHEAEVALYYRSLGVGGDSLLIRPDVRMHAASTMKVPVLLQLYLDHERGVRSLDDSLAVRTSFASIVDGAPYELDASSDSDASLHARVGGRASLRELAILMITRSSNLATNLLIAELDARRVTGTLRALGADSIEVLRGVEDLPAFEAGLSNTTTARDLGRVFALLGGAATGAGRTGADPATGVELSEQSRREMLAILERQEFRAKIPAGLPAGVRVANKTGWITAVSHDAAIVFPPADPPYVLVVLTRGVAEDEAAETLIAEISRRVWALHTGGTRVVGGG